MRGKKPTKPEVRREVIAIIAAARRGERDPASEAYETSGLPSRLLGAMSGMLAWLVGGLAAAVCEVKAQRPWRGGGQAGFLASSIRRRRDAFSASVAVFRLSPATSYSSSLCVRRN
jgi:hypothetical protein